MPNEASADEAENCKHCGSEIEGEPLNQLSDVEFDDEAAEEEGFTELKATYGDGPYCSFSCLNAPRGEDDGGR